MNYGDTVGLAARLNAELGRRGEGVSTAESLTVGRVHAAIGSVPGASDVLVGGLTAYNLPTKVCLLDVDESTAAACDCVSKEVAIQMAAGVRKHFGTALTIATTGYAEPSPPKNQEAMAWIAVDYRGEVRPLEVRFPGVGRIEAQEFVAKAAIKLALDVIEEMRTPGGLD